MKPCTEKYTKNGMQGEWIVNDDCEHHWIYDYDPADGFITQVCYYCGVKKHPEI